MQAGTTSPRPRVSNIASWLVVLAGVSLLVLLLLSFVLEARPQSSGSGAVATGPGRIAFFEFGVSADTLWLVDASNPAERERLLSAPHAREFGVVPSISPDGRSLAYAALPANATAPSPDTPAGLWVTSIARNAQPRLLVNRVDLRVPAVWSPDGDSLVFRRSNADGFALIDVAASGGAERVVAQTDGSVALFPIAFAKDSARFYYVELSEQGSRLIAAEVATSAQTEVAPLSPGITRDWTLSKDGSRLAFLAMSYTPTAVSARAYLVDLASGKLTPVTEEDVNAFGPVWATDGSLLVGTLGANGRAGLVRFDGVLTTQLPGPARGFDVPLGFSRDGAAYLVRAFSGASATAPGAATLTLIDENGERQVIASGDVSFVGWSAP